MVALARRQHGVVASRQLAEAGIGREWVRHRVAKGWLRRLHRGVYLVGPLESSLSRPMAAVLAAGSGAVLSHHSASALWDIRPYDGPPHVTVVGRDVRSRGFVVHRTTQLHIADATRHRGVPTTSPARTLLDLAATLPPRDHARATEEAQVRRLASVDSLNEQLGRYPRHRGTAALRRVIRSDPKLTRSEAERRTLELIRAARLPEPETNARLAGYEVDFLWRPQRLILEIDGYAFHSARSSFERDRRKTADLTAAGHRIARATWRQLTEEPHALVATLAAALSRA